MKVGDVHTAKGIDTRQHALGKFLAEHAGGEGTSPPHIRAAGAEGSGMDMTAWVGRCASMPMYP